MRIEYQVRWILTLVDIHKLIGNVQGENVEYTGHRMLRMEMPRNVNKGKTEVVYGCIEGGRDSGGRDRGGCEM